MTDGSLLLAEAAPGMLRCRRKRFLTRRHSGNQHRAHPLPCSTQVGERPEQRAANQPSREEWANDEHGRHRQREDQEQTQEEIPAVEMPQTTVVTRLV
jgi:hypothetical protein